ncbi:MAG: hypothetical protein KJ645_12630 [Planctomycetes bacterium]|nr:hypothetical protein [Planctomycetota bacterium]
MSKMVWLTLIGGLVLYGLSGSSLQAQNAVCNPFFSTTDLQHWTSDAPSIAVVYSSPDWGMLQYCCRKFPGLPNNNASLYQEVHLFAGYTYEFSANIAASYICPG